MKLIKEYNTKSYLYDGFSIHQLMLYLSRPSMTSLNGILKELYK